MSWFRIDDQAHAHRKFRRAGGEAVGLWTLCGSYASSSACDGSGHLLFDEVENEARKLGIKDWRKVAGRLVECGDPAHSDQPKGAGLWEATDTGFQFHHWDHYREGGEAELKRARESNKARQKAFRDRKKPEPVTDRNVTDNVTPSRPSNVTSNADRNALPDPTRPDPTKHPQPPEGVCVASVFAEVSWPAEEPADRSMLLTSLRVDWAHAQGEFRGNLPGGAPNTPEENLALEALWGDARAHGVAWATYPAKLREKLATWHVGAGKYFSKRPTAFADWLARVRDEDRRAADADTHDGKTVSLARALRQ